MNAALASWQGAAVGVELQLAALNALNFYEIPVLLIVAALRVAHESVADDLFVVAVGSRAAKLLDYRGQLKELLMQRITTTALQDVSEVDVLGRVLVLQRLVNGEADIEDRLKLGEDGFQISTNDHYPLVDGLEGRRWVGKTTLGGRGRLLSRHDVTSLSGYVVLRCLPVR